MPCCCSCLFSCFAAAFLAIYMPLLFTIFRFVFLSSMLFALFPDHSMSRQRWIRRRCVSPLSFSFSAFQCIKLRTPSLFASWKCHCSCAITYIMDENRIVHVGHISREVENMPRVNRWGRRDIGNGDPNQPQMLVMRARSTQQRAHVRRMHIRFLCSTSRPNAHKAPKTGSFVVVCWLLLIYIMFCLL